MSITINPTSIIAPLEKKFAVYVEVTDNVEISKVKWSLLPAAKGRIDPAESEVELKTFVQDTPEGPRQVTRYYAFTEIYMLTAGSATLHADGLGAAPDSATADVTGIVMEIDNDAIFKRNIAHNPEFGVPIEPSIEDQTLEIAFRLHGDVDGLDEGIPDMPVYIKFVPPVPTVYQLGADGRTWAPASYPNDPDGKGMVARTDPNGNFLVRAGSREQVLGRVEVITAGESYEETFAIATFKLREGEYSVPIGDGLKPSVNLNKFTSPTFYARIPEDVPVEDAEYAMMWMQGKDGVERYGAITSPDDLMLNGEPFAFTDVITDGTRSNSIAYLVQSKSNATQSAFLRFSATGTVPVGPDPSITDRPLPLPLINVPVVNVYNAKRGIIITVPKFTAADLEPADVYILQVMIYLSGWDHETGAVRDPATLLLTPLTYALADIPAVDIPFLLAYLDVSGWDKSPAPQNMAGRFRAEYTITTVKGVPGSSVKTVVHSKILGINPIIELDTPPTPLPEGITEQLPGMMAPKASRRIQGVPIPESDDDC